MAKETGWDHLLGLNGITLVVDDRLGYWVKIVVLQVPHSEKIPHGVSYSMTLHDRAGNRVLGFDNAHTVAKGKPADHWHRNAIDAGRRYEFDSPEKLLSDFWLQVDRVLKENNDD
jgi:hypothetical protein